MTFTNADNCWFLVFFLLFGGLAVALGVENQNTQDKTQGRAFFAGLFGVLAAGLALYKMSSLK